MLIYAAADIHGHPRRIRHLKRQIADHRPDVLVLAGDISRRWQPHTVLDGLNRLGLPVLVIRETVTIDSWNGCFHHFPACAPFICQRRVLTASRLLVSAVPLHCPLVLDWALESATP